MSADQRLRDLFDGDPGSEQFEYHQDYRGEAHWSNLARAGVIIPFFLCLAAFVYHTLRILEFDLLPLSELIWNCIVYLTPSRLLDAVEKYTSPLSISNPARAATQKTHAAKSEAMRRILGLDAPGGIMNSVAQAGRRRLSTLPGIMVGAHGEDGRPAGLGNWDNSCYQNSVLQGLASLDSLSQYLTGPDTDDRTPKGEPRPDMKMADALRGLIATLNDPSNNGKRIWTPATLKSMSSWQQQDAQEYFSKVLDEIDREVGKVVNALRASKGFKTEDSTPESSVSSESVPAPMPRNPLEGLIAQRVGCMRCGYSEGLSMIPFNCLTVPLGGAWQYDVAECLDEYTKLEPIEGVECGKCTLLRTQDLLSTIQERMQDAPEDDPVRKTTAERLAAVSEALEEEDYEDKTLLQKCKIPPNSRVSSTKSRQAVIARPPKSLAVHFNRSLFDEYTGELKKNHAEVRFPKILDLGPWCLGSSGATDDASIEQWLLNPGKPMIATSTRQSRLRGPLYELRAVVTHYGRHENGHYICYKKHPTPVTDEKGDRKEQWWRLSDDDVMKVSEENVLGQGGVFMLFFDSIEPGTTVSPRAVPLESSVTVEVNDAPELILATRIPLPDDDDSDISEGDERESSLATWGESAATSVSGYDDEENEDYEPQDYEPQDYEPQDYEPQDYEPQDYEPQDYEPQDYEPQDYEPTRAIIVPASAHKMGVHNRGAGAGQASITNHGNMLMV